MSCRYREAASSVNGSSVCASTHERALPSTCPSSNWESREAVADGDNLPFDQRSAEPTLVVRSGVGAREALSDGVAVEAFLLFMERELVDNSVQIATEHRRKIVYR